MPELFSADGRAPNLRGLAHALLVRVHGGARLQPILAAALERRPLAPPARAWLTELTQGTLRHEQALDQALAAFLKTPVASLPPPVRVALRLGAYQLLYMRTATHAAVKESVALIGPRFGRLRALANAVLRRLSETPRAAAARAGEGAPSALPPLALSADEPASITAWATACSQPAWFVAALLAQLGPEEATACLLAHTERPRLWLRVNERRSSRATLAAALAAAGHAPASLAALPAALSLAQSGAVRDLPGYAEGHFSVQDGAAQAVGLALAPPAGATVLDACAAPGGKALHLLEQVGPDGHVVAVDRHAPRLARLPAEAARLGTAAWLTCAAFDLSAADAPAQLARWGAPFDYILLDAPCSGMGTLRRHPELRKREASSLPELLALQQQLLRTLCAALAPGGRLVYAVCSPLWAEGREQVAAVLAARPELRQVPLPASLAPLAAPDGLSLATWPHRHGLDGFYAACLERRGEPGPTAPTGRPATAANRR